MKKVPKYVFANGGKADDWVPKCDLYKGDIPEKFKEVTQEKWWLTNWRIRKALALIENDVQSRIATNQKLSLRMVSILRIAKLSKLNRLSVSHIDRITWVDLARTELIKLIQRPVVSVDQARMKANKKMIQDLRRRLHAQREETVVWITQTHSLNEEIRLLTRTLKNYESAIQNLKNDGNNHGNSRNLRID